MDKRRTFRKDPDAILDYGFDWSTWLASGDMIQTSTWIVPAGLTSGVTEKSDTDTRIWLSAGTTDQTYEIRNEITTILGRTNWDTFRLIVEIR